MIEAIITCWLLLSLWIVATIGLAIIFAPVILLIVLFKLMG